MINYSYHSFSIDTKKLSNMVVDFKPDTIIAIARGGLTLAHRLSVLLNIRNIYSISSKHYDDKIMLKDVIISNIPNLNSAKNVLVVDDIVDRGKTMQKIIAKLKEKFDLNYKSLTIFYKKDAIYTPDIWLKTTDKWIEFFWEEI